MEFTEDELKMIFHVFGNTVGQSKIRDDIFDKVRIELYGEDVLHPISPDLKIAAGWSDEQMKNATSGWIVLSDSDIEKL
ncbi:hypothetical protein vBPpSSYP_173 [Pseudomonas phage vB_PpS_SYP]|nr:hypothetical protein vBPpSSYP_173 [Pseudomonas phage vB_PpS_SYP]